jgi:cupin 2 domain-containing protein
MSSVQRGRLLRPDAAPNEGERFEPVIQCGNVRIEQILSASSDDTADYVQEHDEWVVLLAGSATLVVAGERCELTAGDWILLPAGVPHEVVRTAGGTSWLAVHMHRAS